MNVRSSEHRVEGLARMSENTRAAESRAVPRARRWILGKRRRFLVPGSYQMRAILGAAGLSVLLLAILDFTIWRLQQARSEKVLAAAPELTRLINAQDAMQFGLILLASAVGLLAVVAIVLFESHKTAGPIYSLKNVLRWMAEHGTGVRVKFRKDDHFQDLAEAFNAMTQSLEDRSSERAGKIALVASSLRQAAKEIAEGTLDDVGARERIQSLASDLDRVKDSLAHG